jgi:uncharacterized caspase-like protein
MNRLILVKAAIAMGLFCTSFWPDSAFADKRVALVVGNSTYRNAPALLNPVRDARAMAAKFKEAGYEVITVADAGNLQFKRAIREFQDAAVLADIAVVFFAGHGIEISGVNYLIPVDARLASDRDAEDEAITLDRLVWAVEDTKRLGLIILDACRDNPFVSRMRRQSAPTPLRGLPLVEPTRPIFIQPTGLSLGEPTTRNNNTLIAYAAKAGTAAEDGIAEHSPFTAALLNNLFEPGLDVRFAFGRVRDDVLKSTGNRQEPYVFGSLGGQNVALVPAPEQTRPVLDAEASRRDFELVEKLTNGAAPADAKRVWEAFLAQHKAGLYPELARRQLAMLVEQQDAARKRIEELESARAAEEAKRQRSDLEAELRGLLGKFIAVRGEGSVADRARALLSSLDRDRDIRAFINRGRGYALIIGNKDYSDPAFNKLETPHEDARSLGNILTTHYGFMTELILRDGSVKSLILLDRPMRELYSLLDDLQESMTTDDRLLIFYAGHGHLDPRTGKAYWIPVEAHDGRPAEFISADSIVSALRRIKARSVLIVVDSCFSGSSFRDASARPEPSDEELANSLAKDAERSSRVLMPVAALSRCLMGEAADIRSSCANS